MERSSPTRVGISHSPAHFFAGRFDEAVAWAVRAVSDQPKHALTHRTLALALAMLGRIDEAQRAMAESVRLAPQARLGNIADWVPPYRRPEDVTRYVEALRLSGMPE
jgi:Flp pilus assembly protein TadD